MTKIRFSYFNYARGGRPNTGYTGDSEGPCDYTGLVEVMRDDWPDVLVMGEGERYELHGRKGAWEAAAAMRAAGGPPYVPHCCSLPRDGMFAPVIFTNATTIVVRRFYDHRLPDFAGRNRNLLEFTLPDRDQVMRVLGWHGDIHSGDARLADARTFDRFADPSIPCAILADWNSVPSGPWEPTDLNKRGLHTARQLAWRIQWQHGPAQKGPHTFDTRALDYLIGYWDEDLQQRCGGIGFSYAAELAGDLTPTQIERPNGRQPIALDGIVLNKPFAEGMVEGSYRVHPFPDPDNPVSDHHRVSVTLDL